MSELLKRQIAAARGDILILVTDDMELLTKEFIQELACKEQELQRQAEEANRLADEAEQARLAAAEEQRQGRDPRINLHVVKDLSKFTSLPEGSYSLVICIGRDNAQTHRLYALANPFKKANIPVVFGNPQRGLIFTSPTWRDVDLHMSGMFYLANQYIRSIGKKGSYAEFGVFDGRSMTLAYHALKDSVDKFFGFDSFEGIVGSQDDESRVFPDGSHYANIETFWHNMGVAGVDEKRVVPVKGIFQETLANNEMNHASQRYSICYVDSDIYEAAYLVLNYIKSRLLPGALIMFDEYHTFGADPNRGERRAVRQWLDENPDIILEHYRNFSAFGAGFIYRLSGSPQK